MLSRLLCFVAVAVLAAALPGPTRAQHRVLHGHFCGGSGARSEGGYGIFDEVIRK